MPPTKAQLAAKARKKALKAKKNTYSGERMTLDDAINVLRVRRARSHSCVLLLTCIHVPQAVEVAAPNSTYELVIKTLLERGAAIPKGRYSLPRETKQTSHDRILVFAEGKAADEAKRAGADIVGGPELIDGVRIILVTVCSLTDVETSYRSSAADTRLRCSCAHRTSFAQSPRN